MVSREPKQLGVRANQSYNSRHITRHLAALALFLTLATTAWAQKDTGSIVGTVKDSTGAVVPDAKVSVADPEMGINFVTSTNSSGEYVATPLKIGRYTVTVVKQGFKTAVLGPVDLQVQQRLALDATLQVGEVTQEVQVTEIGRAHV